MYDIGLHFSKTFHKKSKVTSFILLSYLKSYFVEQVKTGNYTYRGVSSTNKGMANMICWKSLQSSKALSSEVIVAEPKVIPKALVSGATERLLLGMYSKTVGNEMTW